MVEGDVRSLVERYRKGWFGHDVDAIMSVVTDDVVFLGRDRRDQLPPGPDLP